MLDILIATWTKRRRSCRNSPATLPQFSMVWQVVHPLVRDVPFAIRRFCLPRKPRFQIMDSTEPLKPLAGGYPLSLLLLLEAAVLTRTRSLTGDPIAWHQSITRV